MSRNQIWRVTGALGTLIVKATQSTEARFYQLAASQLDVQAVHTPQLFAHYQVDGADWIVIEFVPQPLPKARWLADVQAIDQLRLLHRAELTLPVDGWFRPKWTPQMTAAALNYLSSSVANTLYDLQQRAQPIFEPTCWISADPNPRNWGVRANGEVVLFDWERFSRGTPALDLAITIPGLGSLGDYHAVAGMYLNSAETAHPLVHQMILAKAWTIVEFLANVHSGAVAETTGVAYLAQYLPQWLETVAATITP